MADAPRDQNQVTVSLAVDDTTGLTRPFLTDADGNLLIAASFTAATVPDGGTGRTSFTAYAPIFGGTTATGALQSGTVGSLGEVLTSNGAGALPTFQPVASSGGTVTTVSVVTANGVSGSVATATTTPAITLTLGAITPTTTNGLTITPNGTNTLNITAGKSLVTLKSISFTAADDTGTYTLPTGTKTLVATDVATLSSLASIGTIVTGVWNGTDIAVADGGTGLSTLTANNVILGNGTSAVQFVAPSTSGNILTSNGTTWTSAAPVATTVPRRNLNIIFDAGTYCVAYASTPAVETNINGISCNQSSDAGQEGVSISCNAVANWDFYDKSPEINITEVYQTGSATGSGRIYFGDLGGTPASGNAPTNTQITKSMFVVCITAAGTPTYYAVNADGAANTNTSLAGITASQTNNWRVVKNASTNIKFYCNYTLKATHTTNLPSGDTAVAEFIIVGEGNNTGDANSRVARFGFLDVLLDSPTT